MELAEPAEVTRGSGVVKEFKEFISRGNVVDLAVAVVIGAAFTAVVTAFIEGLVTPRDRHDRRQGT